MRSEFEDEASDKASSTAYPFGRRISTKSPSRAGGRRRRPKRTKNGSQISPFWGPKASVLGPGFGSEIGANFGTDLGRDLGRLGVHFGGLLGSHLGSVSVSFFGPFFWSPFGALLGRSGASFRSESLLVWRLRRSPWGLEFRQDLVDFEQNHDDLKSEFEDRQILD